MQEEININQVEKPASNGKVLLAGAAIVGGAALLAGTKKAWAVSPPIQYSAIPGTGDIKVLNYALALEALEADLYSQALKRLTTGGTNGLGQTITGLGLSASNPIVSYTQEFGVVETDHRDFLISALGTQAITATALANAQFDFGITTMTANDILDFLITVEATGVQAYIGAVPSFSVQSPYLPIAAAIQGTEARHTAALTVIKNRLTGSTLPPAPLATTNGGRDGALPQQTVLNAVSQYIVFPGAV